MSLKHVTQEHRSGCGIACAAMISGISYKGALEWWQVQCKGDVSRLTAVGPGAGMRINELRDLLDGMMKDTQVVEAPCVVIIKKPNGIRHFVVIDSDGTVLDPLKAP